MENKKTKLTLSGIAKKSIENIELAKTQSKNSVVIEKKPNRFLTNEELGKDKYRAIADFISGMTDRFAIKLHKNMK